MRIRARIITIRYASPLPYSARQPAEERLRTKFQRALGGDVLVRFEDVLEGEFVRHTRVRITGSWPEPLSTVYSKVMTLLLEYDTVA